MNTFRKRIKVLVTIGIITAIIGSTCNTWAITGQGEYLGQEYDHIVTYACERYPLVSVFECSYPSKFKKERNKVFEFLKILDEHPGFADDEDSGAIPGSLAVIIKGGVVVDTSQESEIYYYGDVKNNKPNGWGMVYSSNAIKQKKSPKLVGQFKDGKPNGYGACLSRLSGSIIWECSDFVCGYGLFYPNGDAIYYYSTEDPANVAVGTTPRIEFESVMSTELHKQEGNLLGLEDYNFDFLGLFADRHLVLCPAVKYEGKMKDDQFSGKGKLYYDVFQVTTSDDPIIDVKDSCYGYLMYEGDFKDNDKEGKGKDYYYYGKIRYDGEFKDDVYNGKGTYYDKDGSVYHKGKFKNGKIKK